MVVNHAGDLSPPKVPEHRPGRKYEKVDTFSIEATPVAQIGTQVLDLISFVPGLLGIQRKNGSDPLAQQLSLQASTL
jgi:hypothetical protein